jgi:hypothetical protein
MSVSFKIKMSGLLQKNSGITAATRASVQYEGVSKRSRNGRLVEEPQMVQLSATMCSCIAIL